MKNLNELDTLEIDFSAISPIENISENIMLSEELLEKYKIEIDESKIEQIIAEIPEEHRKTLSFEDKIEYIRKILAFDVSVPIKNLFDDVLYFVSKL